MAPDTRGVVRRVRQPVTADVDAARDAAVLEARVRIPKAAKKVATWHQPHIQLEVGALARRARGVGDEKLQRHERIRDVHLQVVPLQIEQRPIHGQPVGERRLHRS